MTAEPVPLRDLLSTREKMVRDLQSELDTNERRFLLSLVANEPDWSLLSVPHAKDLPAIRWKLHNLKQLQKSNPKKLAEQSAMLARLLDI